MTDIAVHVDGVWKRFHRGEIHDSLRDLVPALARRALGRGPKRGELREGDFWALQDVSLEVRRGEVLGIIGANGAGKSTLLKLLARILRPNRGRIRVNGRLRALIEIAAGFHPDLTGRENIYLNGTILGMKHREIDARFDEIVEFSGIERFLDTPVKRYSSGMYARLGFAVAAHLEPEILVVDEVLAVGDAEFQQKCLGKMGDVARGGRTVLFVSHNMAAVQSLCERVMLLRQGEVLGIGSTEQMIAAYLGCLQRADRVRLADRTDRSGNGEVRLSEIRISAGGTYDSDVVLCGSELHIELEFLARRRIEHPVFFLAVHDMMGTLLCHMNTRATAQALPVDAGPGRIACNIPRLPLCPGQYSLNVAVTEGTDMLDRVQKARVFTVEGGDFHGTGNLSSARAAKFLVDYSWTPPVIVEAR